MAPIALQPYTESGLPPVRDSSIYRQTLSKRQIGLSVLAGWPTSVESPLVWDGTQICSDAEWAYTLTPLEKREINAALKSFKDLCLDGSEVGISNFPLPTLERRLQGLAVVLHHGRGFFALRGLDPSDYSPEDNIIIFMGISSYIAGERGRQDDDGNMLAHIQEAKKSSAPQEERPIRDSRLASTFHTDMFCDVLAMQTRSLAAKGGNHIVASAGRIYNELAATRPDVLKVLANPKWHFDHRGRMSQPDERPILYYHNGRVIFSFSTPPLTGLRDLPRSSGLPKPSPEQLEALDVVQAIAEENQLVLDLQPGDLTFINNFGVLHSREAFEDDTLNTRYLVRMWLKNEHLAWELPSPLQSGNKKIYEGDAEEKWNILPTPRIRFEAIERFTS